MGTSAILKILSILSTTIQLTPQVLAIIQALKTAVNSTPGSPEHTAAVAVLNPPTQNTPA